MTNLDTYLAGLAGPTLKWIQGRVTSVQSGFLTMSYAGSDIPNVAYLSHYTPVIGDYVHAISQDEIGVLVLGKTEGSTPVPPIPIPQIPQVFTANDTATYDQTTDTWTPTVLVQSPDEVACFFYTPASFVSAIATILQLVEIEIIRVSGGPPTFIPHLNLNTATSLQIPGDLSFWRPDVVLPIGTPTWVPLPVGWGQDLVSGDIKGIGIWTDLDVTGVYSGTGRVRLTPLSVTM